MYTQTSRKGRKPRRPRANKQSNNEDAKEADILRRSRPRRGPKLSLGVPSFDWSDVVSLVESQLPSKAEVARKGASALKSIGSKVWDGTKSIASDLYNKFRGPVLAKSEVKADVKRELAKDMSKQHIYSGPSDITDFGMAPSLKGQSDGSSLVTGSEILTVLPTTSTVLSEGNLVYTADLNPNTLNLNMLKSMCKNFEQIQGLSMEIIFQGAGGSTAAGSMILYYDPDPDDQHSSSSNLARVAANARHRIFTSPRAASDRLIIPIAEKGKLYLGSDPYNERFQSFGNINLVVVNPIASGVNLGTLYIKYRFKLFATQTDSSIYSGDFFAGKMAGSFTTSSQLDSTGWGTVPSMSTMTLPTTSVDMYKAGGIEMSAGNYHVTLTVSGCNSVTYGTRLFNVIQTGKYAPWANTTNGFTFLGNGATGPVFIQQQWVGCLSNFRIGLAITGGTWTGVDLWVSAVTASPYASSFSQLRRLTDLTILADKQDVIVEQLKDDMVRKEDMKEAKEKTSSKQEIQTQDDGLRLSHNYFVSPTSSSSSSSSSSSALMSSTFRRPQ